METILDLIVERAGGATALADQLGIQAPSIASWRRAGQVPAERVLAVSRLTRISPHAIRPDIYPDPNWIPPA